MLSQISAYPYPNEIVDLETGQCGEISKILLFLSLGKLLSGSLILGERTLLRLALAGLGFLGTLALGIVNWRFYMRVGQLIAQIKEVPS